MITGVIKNNARNGSKLIVTLPCSLYDLRNHLASIGITSEASKPCPQPVFVDGQMQSNAL